MRVATYNIRHGAPAGRRADLRGMQSAVASLGADVVALQEVDHHVIRSCFADQTRRFARAAGLTGHFVAARSLGPFGRYGNALLVRGVPVRVERLALRSLGEPRAAILATLELHGPQTGKTQTGVTQTGVTQVTVLSTHLQNRRDGRPDEAPDQLDELLAALADRPGPAVLMGDLNLRPEVVSPRLAAAGMLTVPSTPTFPADRPRLRIDWIAVRGLEIRSWEVPDLRASDHRPIVADLVPAPPTPDDAAASNSLR